VGECPMSSGNEERTADAGWLKRDGLPRDEQTVRRDDMECMSRCEQVLMRLAASATHVASHNPNPRMTRLTEGLAMGHST